MAEVHFTAWDWWCRFRNIDSNGVHALIIYYIIEEMIITLHDRSFASDPISPHALRNRRSNGRNIITFMQSLNRCQYFSKWVTNKPILTEFLPRVANSLFFRSTILENGSCYISCLYEFLFIKFVRSEDKYLRFGWWTPALENWF